MSELLSMREYAKRRGVSAQAVSNAVKDGRIAGALVKVPGGTWPKLDAEKADALWEANTEEAKGPKPKDEDEVDAPPKQRGPSYAQARAVRENYRARITRLEFEQKVGKLAEVDKVKEEAFRVHRAVRDALLAVPGRVHERLAVEGDAAVCFQLVEAEILLALEELAGDAFA